MKGGNRKACNRVGATIKKQKMSQSYTLNFINNSASTVSACVFQLPQGNSLWPSDVQTLAWLVQSCAASTGNAVFTWTTEYCFVCAPLTQQLAPGIVLSSPTVLPVTSMSSGNEVTLDYSSSATPPAFEFTNQANGTPAGSLYILQTDNVPMNEGAVGIGMSGEGTFVVPAEPNIDITITPGSTPFYCVTAGQFTQGEVLSSTQLATSVQVVFPPNVYTMYATLGADNLVTISQFPA